MPARTETIMKNAIRSIEEGVGADRFYQGGAVSECGTKFCSGSLIALGAGVTEAALTGWYEGSWPDPVWQMLEQLGYTGLERDLIAKKNDDYGHVSVIRFIRDIGFDKGE